MNLERIAYGLLVPAPMVFAGRAILEVAGGPHMPGFALAIVGILSGAGMLSLLVALRGRPTFPRALLAVAVALAGHYIVARFVDPDLGGALVYLGTSMAAALRRPLAIYAGLVAATGALLRSTQAATAGHIILAVGALGLAAFLVLATLAPPAKPRQGDFDNKAPDTGL